MIQPFENYSLFQQSTSSFRGLWKIKVDLIFVPRDTKLRCGRERKKKQINKKNINTIGNFLEIREKKAVGSTAGDLLNLEIKGDPTKPSLS